MSDITQSQTKAERVAKLADDIKAERIETLDVRAKTSIADYFVVCSGNSDTHVNSIAGRVEEKMKEEGIKPLRSETGGGSGWVLLDFGDVIFHVMLEEKRQFYDLETLWNNLQPDPDLV